MLNFSNISSSGIHKLFHCAPNVPHYAKNKAVGVMKQGQTFTIEPMISEGVWTDQTWPDNWTAVTTDGRLSAQVITSMYLSAFPCRMSKFESRIAINTIIIASILKKKIIE